MECPAGELRAARVDQKRQKRRGQVAEHGDEYHEKEVRPVRRGGIEGDPDILFINGKRPHI